METILLAEYHGFDIDKVTVEREDDDGITTIDVTIYLNDGSFEVHSYREE